MVPRQRGVVPDVPSATPASPEWPTELVDEILAYERKLDAERKSEHADEERQNTGGLDDRFEQLSTA